jgi:hypothetical protein
MRPVGRTAAHFTDISTRCMKYGDQLRAMHDEEERVLGFEFKFL